MSGERPPDWRAGLRLLEEREAGLPAALRALAAAPSAALPSAARGARRFLTTGLGSSAAHARFLAVLLGEALDARFVPMSSLAAPAPGSQDDVLIVFSQGLSPNARPLVAAAARWKHVVLVTAARGERADEPRRRVLDALHGAGGSVRTIPAEDEYGTLVRIAGPMLGYLEALRLAAEIGRVTGAPVPALPDVDHLCSRVVAAARELDAALARAGIRSLDGFERGLALVACGAYGGLCSNLQYKVLEGMLLPMPPVWDVLELAHGPLQQGFDQPMTLLALTHAGDRRERQLLERVDTMLERSRHRLVVLDAALPGPLAVFEHEALVDRLCLRFIAERQVDQVGWPGHGRDRPLYDFEDWLDPSTFAEPSAEGVGDRVLESITSPELERLVARGATTAVLPLGSTEQHGAHLPLSTDTRIADALAERFCRGVPEAIRLPALAIGCSSEHLGFPGTLSISPRTLAAIVADVAESLRQSGFRRLFVFSAHGGNFAALAEALPDIARGAAPLDVSAFTDLAALTAAIHGASAAGGVSAEASGHHAGEFETSILLALDPRAVRQASTAAGLLAPTEDAQAIFYPSLRVHAPSGVVGDPTRARADRAERYLAAWTDLLIGAYRCEKNER